VETIPAGPQAARIAEEASVRLLNQVYERRNPKTRATVAHLFARYLDEAVLEPTTRSVYRGYTAKHLLPLLGPHKIGALDAGVMDSFYAELRRCREHYDRSSGLLDHRVEGKHVCTSKCTPHE